MGAFKEAIGEVYQFNIVQLALFLFGPGHTVPPQTSSGPLSSCVAPLTYYHMVSQLHYFLVLAVSCSSGPACLVKYKFVTAWDSLQGVTTMTTRIKLCLLALFSILLSVVDACLELTTYYYILQVKVLIFCCLPADVKVGVYLAHIIVGTIYIFVYFTFTWSVIFSY
ncbi:hypothetical protein ACP4OV_017230 [Aristida adscensionis]